MVRGILSSLLEWITNKSLEPQRQLTVIDEYGMKKTYSIIEETTGEFRVTRPDFRFSAYNGIVPQIRKRFSKDDPRIVRIR